LNELHKPLVGNTFDSYFISSDTTSNMTLNSVEAPVDTNLKSASDMSSRIDKKMKFREGAEKFRVRAIAHRWHH
jgi:uncharacterized protein YgiM (DUF1202 family)